MTEPLLPIVRLVNDALLSNDCLLLTTFMLLLLELIRETIFRQSSPFYILVHCIDTSEQPCHAGCSESQCCESDLVVVKALHSFSLAYSHSHRQTAWHEMTYLF